MNALLRHIYDLPYQEGMDVPPEKPLEPHALIYATAENYQLEDFQHQICAEMERIMDFRLGTNDSDQICDLINALRIIVSSTTRFGDPGRKLLTEACVANINDLKHEPSFMSLLRQNADLGAVIIGHVDVKFKLPKAWQCLNGCQSVGVEPQCRNCHGIFGREFQWTHRHEKQWVCTDCGEKNTPWCPSCL